MILVVLKKMKICKYFSLNQKHSRIMFLSEKRKGFWLAIA